MILVYTENWENKFKKITFELVSYAYALAQQTSDKVTVLSVGAVPDSELQTLSTYGASEIIAVNNPALAVFDGQTYAKIINEISVKINAKYILLSAGNKGKAIGPVLSVLANAAFISGVEGLPVSYEPVTLHKKTFTGKSVTTVKINTGKVVLGLYPNSWQITENQEKATIIFENINVEPSPFTLLETNTSSGGKVLLSEAEIVVSGGRGMKAPENWQPIEELATLLNAATACSRPVADEGWRPHHEHVGQTGKIIAPKLYFAFGISGAIQHYGGISSSKCIVAVNTDKDAPIFENADYGIIGDAKTVIPEIIKGIKEIL